MVINGRPYPWFWSSECGIAGPYLITSGTFGPTVVFTVCCTELVVPPLQFMEGTKSDRRENKQLHEQGTFTTAI